MKTVYVVMWMDRHREPLPYVFHRKADAITWARDRAREEVEAYPHRRLDESLTPNMRQAGWLYHASYTCEDDDYLYVLECEVEGT